MFARCLKAHPEFAHLDAEAATARLDVELDRMFPDCPAPWVKLGLPDFDSRGELGDPRTDFRAVWDSIDKPFRMGSKVHEAAERADEKPLDLGGRFGAPADAPFVRLLSVCYWLGRLAGGDFYLSSRDAGEALGVSPTTANQLLHRAEELGFIEPVGAYTERERTRRKAREWRFKPDHEVRFLDLGP